MTPWLLILCLAAPPAPIKTLGRARALSDSLEYRAAIPLLESVLSHEELPVEVRLEAYLLLGSAQAVVGNTVAAERAFRFLLRADPDFDLPGQTSPKILGLFRKVQFEQRAIRDQLRELERNRLLESLELDGAPPVEVDGGTPLELSYKLRDPRGAVSALEVRYRRRGEPNFSSIALAIGDDGRWRGIIPAEWTANPAGFVLEYYVTSHDRQGDPLLTVGEPRTPLTIDVHPGEVATEPFYSTVWFWTVVGVVAVGAGVGGWFAYDQATSLPDNPLGTHEVR